MGPRRGAQGAVPVQLTFRVTDASGQALDDSKPVIEAVTEGATVDSVDSDPRANGLFTARVRPGRTAGPYTFVIKAGSVSRQFAVVVQ